MALTDNKSCYKLHFYKYRAENAHKRQFQATTTDKEKAGSTPMCCRPAWALTDSNRRPSACKADALNQLS